MMNNQVQTKPVRGIRFRRRTAMGPSAVRANGAEFKAQQPSARDLCSGRADAGIFVFFTHKCETAGAAHGRPRPSSLESAHRVRNSLALWRVEFQMS